MATLGSLPVGSVVKSLNTKYNNAVIRFLVGHQDTANGRTKLITERIITLKPFDAKEPTFPDNGIDISLNIRQYGNAIYHVSNIMQWLNSNNHYPWYSKKHDYDEPPSNGYIYNDYNGYLNEAGFLTNFETSFYEAILPTNVVHFVPRGAYWFGGNNKVYLLSKTEVGQGAENGATEGEPWEYFSSNTRRKCKPTAEAVSMSEYTHVDLNYSSPWSWLLRTIYTDSSHYVRIVRVGGTTSTSAAYNGTHGIRPALELSNTQRVSDAADVDGAYILQWGQPPTTPSSISYGTPQAGMPLTITTGGSTDPEGKSISYVWEIKIDSGAYTQVGITSAKTITKTVPTSGTTYQARVKAVNSDGMESAYRTGAAKTINHNTPPVISGSDSNLGAMTTPVTYSYTVTDAQAPSQTITVTEKLTNGTETITLRTFSATSGATNTIDLTSNWLKLLPGSHTLTITASDGQSDPVIRTITFSRTVTRIAASRAFTTDAIVERVFLSVFPANRPADSALHMEVSNNPFDTSPVWEDISAKVNSAVHIFTNTTATNGFGLAYRFYYTKGATEIEVTQVTIRVA